ncbi:MAG: putative secretion system protein GspD-like [Rhodocyclales bacterium]|nr:putative secretion system protein GspD-like [Rhodocyclales bacterium]
MKTGQKNSTPFDTVVILDKYKFIWHKLWAHAMQRRNRLSHCLGLFITVLALAGCAATQAFREGNALIAAGKNEEGLAKIEEAVKLNPQNIEYRIALASRRSSIINRLVLSGETARNEGRLSDAEKAYRQVGALDANNAMARQGLEAVVLERRHRQVIADAEALLKKGTAQDLADASEKLRTVLQENPTQKDALNLKSRIDDAQTKAQRPEAKLSAVYRKPITLEFRDAPLKAIFDVIAKVSGLNFFFDKEVRPDLKATILAKNTSIEDAVRLLLATNQLEQKTLNENSILIYPNTPQKLKDYQQLSVRTFFLTNADVKAVSNTIKTLVKTKDIVTDERLGIIFMRDTPEAIRMAERIVALQDLGDPEVMLEVEVMEIKRSRLMELGVQWPSQLGLSPLAVGTSALTLNNLQHLSSSTTQATVGSMLINLDKQDQDANILANPRIRVRNKDKAKVLIGDRVPVITTTSTSTGFVSESVSYVDVGLKLEVEPTIYMDDEVAIKINLEVSTLVKEVVSKSGSLTYQIGTRGANTVLRLKNGETQILAGLIDDEDRTTANKVPGIGELPVVGRLFGSQKDDSQRTEILLSITPRIVRSLHRPDLALAEFDSGTETTIGAAALRLNGADPEKLDAQQKPGALPAQPPVAKTPATTVPSVVPAAVPAPAMAPSSPPAAISGQLSVAWQAPAQVKVGEQFSAVLRVNSQMALRGMPLLIGFDPQALQIVNVQEGDFFKQGGVSTNFNQRIDPAQGKIFVALVRQSSSSTDTGINGVGSLVTVTFKALKPSNAKLQVLSLSPEPLPSMPVAVPVEQTVRLVQ